MGESALTRNPWTILKLYKIFRSVHGVFVYFSHRKHCNIKIVICEHSTAISLWPQACLTRSILCRVMCSWKKLFKTYFCQLLCDGKWIYDIVNIWETNCREIQVYINCALNMLALLFTVLLDQEPLDRHAISYSFWSEVWLLAIPTDTTK